jgi:hypothetical protein
MHQALIAVLEKAQAADRASMDVRARKALRYSNVKEKTPVTVAVDVRALAAPGRADSDPGFNQIRLTLYLEDALKLALALIDKLDEAGTAAVYAHLKRSEW